MNKLTIILLFFASILQGQTGAGYWYGSTEPGTITPETDTITMPYSGDLLLFHQAGIGITEDANGVSQWDDLSGNANHSTQSTNTNKPTTDANGAIVFDGVNDWLDMAETWASVNDSAYTIFFVYEYLSDTDQQRLLAYLDNPSNLQILIQSDSVGTDSLSDRFFTTDNAGSIDLRYLDTFLINQERLLTIAASENTSIEARTNGNQVATQSTSAPWNYGGVVEDRAIGSNADATVGFLNGKIKLIAIYDRKLSSSEITEVENAINTYFSIY